MGNSSWVLVVELGKTRENSENHFTLKKWSWGIFYSYYTFDDVESTLLCLLSTTLLSRCSQSFLVNYSSENESGSFLNSLAISNCCSAAIPSSLLEFPIFNYAIDTILV